MKLKDFYKDKKEYGGKCTSINVDDIFRELSRSGIKEVSVDIKEMHEAVEFFIIFAMGEKGNGKIIREGKLDKLFGVKLKLIK